jgi:hypothetical protein
MMRCDLEHTGRGSSRDSKKHTNVRGGHRACLHARCVVSPSDPATLIVVSLVLFVVTAAAAYRSAQRPFTFPRWQGSRPGALPQRGRALDR